MIVSTERDGGGQPTVLASRAAVSQTHLGVQTVAIRAVIELTPAARHRASAKHDHWKECVTRVYSECIVALYIYRLKPHRSLTQALGTLRRKHRFCLSNAVSPQIHSNLPDFCSEKIWSACCERRDGAQASCVGDGS